MFAWSRRSSMNCWGNNGIRYWLWSFSVLRSAFSVLRYGTENRERRTENGLLLQLHYRDAAAALVRRGGGNSRDERMLLQEPGQRAFQLSGAVPMNQAHDALIRQQRFVEEPFGARDRLVDAAADHVQIGRARLARL